MEIYLEHPVHGRKIASLEAEAEFDEKHGWVRSKPIASVSIQEEQLPVNALEGKRKIIRRVSSEGN